MADEESEQDELIDPVVDRMRVFAAVGSEVMLNHARRQAFVTDIARKIDTYATIAARYGFTDERDMAEYLRARPELARAIKEERAAWFAAENAEVQARVLAQRATRELIPEAAQIGLNETVSPSVRLDALTKLARIAGIDGPGARSAETFSNAPDAGGKFSIQIVFPGAGRTETISVTPAPPPEPGPATPDNPVGNPV